jgi:tripartite-type tricarboxylate transporter receptor subunit TctC
MKSVLTASLAALVFAAASPLVIAQQFPVKPMTIIVPIGPGGGYDFTGRLLAEGISKEVGQPVIVENKPGAGTVVGTQYVVKSAPDGYTMVVGGIGSIAHAPLLIKDLPYNPATDLAPLQLVSTNTYTLTTRSDFPAKDLKSLIAYAKANPGKLSMGTPGQGTGQAVATSLFKSLAGVDILEVQYKSAPPVYVDIISGRVDMFFDATGTAQAFVKSGKVRGIATSGSKRDFILPDTPTASEAGLSEMVLEAWTGLFVPAKTPRPIVLRMREVVAKVGASAEFGNQMRSRGYGIYTPPDVDVFLKSEYERWARLLTAAGLKPQ